MAKTFFISDLHLSPQEPEVINLFLRFIDYCIQQNIDGLYVLGDFFNYWLGNDSIEEWHQPIIEAFQKLGKKTKIFFLVGNRDFLIDNTTAKIFNFELISEDYQVINFDTPVTIMHGDTLCTLDTAYQKFRIFVRSPIIKKIYLALPLTLRTALAKNIKKRSVNREDYYTQPEKYDAVLQTVDEIFYKTQTNIIIHGHTHNPKVHSYDHNDIKQYRYVLGDWHSNGAYYLEVSNINDRTIMDLKFFT